MSVLSDIAEEKNEMEMTPMIDVTFLLLIFFMCTIKFKTLEGRLSAYLPRDVGVNQSDAEPIEKVDISVSVLEEGTRYSPKDPTQPWSGEGRFIIRGRKIQYKIGPSVFTEAEEMTKKLKKSHEDDDERPATIDAKPGTMYADIIVALDAAIEAGFTDITFGGAYKK